jgi:hypothetical protein
MDKVIKSKDEKRAKALIDLARNRYLTINELKEPYKLTEEYYEIIRELLTAFMYNSGFKNNNQLTEFAKENIKTLTPSEISLIEELKIKRDNLVYSGEIVGADFLKSRKSAIDWIIEKLLRC